VGVFARTGTVFRRTGTFLRQCLWIARPGAGSLRLPGELAWRHSTGFSVIQDAGLQRARGKPALPSTGLPSGSLLVVAARPAR